VKINGQLYHAKSGLKVNIGWVRTNSIVRLASFNSKVRHYERPYNPKKLPLIRVSASRNVAISNSRIVSQDTEYEYWLAAHKGYRKVPLVGDIGHHAFTAVIKRQVITYSDGSKHQTSWAPDFTYGVWPRGVYNPQEPWKVIDGGIEKNKEMPDVDDILNSRVNGQYSIRKIKISQSLRDRIFNNPQYSGCSRDTYSVAGLGVDCSCLTFATRSWRVFTDEDFRPVGFFLRDPMSLFYQIRNINNSQGEFANNSKVLHSMKYQ
jgi:hypothetical protein